jgi:CHAD domain-containing protein
VRDVDIALELYARTRVPSQHVLWDELRAERAGAEARLRKKAGKIMRAAELRSWPERLGLHKRGATPGVRLMRTQQLLAEYFAAGRAAAKPGTAPPVLHAFRLETKRLRYTLELFRPLYGPGLAERIEELRRIQELLGQANDQVVAAGRLAKRAETDAALQPALAVLQANVKSLHTAFRRFWRERMDDAGIETRWTNYLRRRKKP